MCVCVRTEYSQTSCSCYDLCANCDAPERKRNHINKLPGCIVSAAFGTSGVVYSFAEIVSLFTGA